jgi:hypothetical protein
MSMPIVEGNNRLGFCRLWIGLDEFPDLFRRHRETDPDTPAVEKAARELAANGFDEGGTQQFVRTVCRWGNYPGVAGRVLANNDMGAIQSAFRLAQAVEQGGNVRAALKAILKLHSLGVSFGSKHLKFLAPTKAVVLDAVISGRLGYSLTLDGYEEFLADCRIILDRVAGAGIDFPFPDEGAWRISDIEAAIFAKLQGY